MSITACFNVIVCNFLTRRLTTSTFIIYYSNWRHRCCCEGDGWLRMKQINSPQPQFLYRQLPITWAHSSYLPRLVSAMLIIFTGAVRQQRLCSGRGGFSGPRLELTTGGDRAALPSSYQPRTPNIYIYTATACLIAFVFVFFNYNIDMNSL